MFRNCLTSAVLLLFINACNAALTCSPPDVPINGRVIGTPTIQTARGLAYAVGATVQFACDPGFGLAGADEAFCLGDGQFSEDPPFCAAITCKRPQVENGILTATLPPGASPPSAGVYQAGTVVSLRCNTGYSMIPAEGRTSKCQNSGQWSPSLASCKHVAARCPLPITPQNAIVVSKSPTNGSTDVNSFIAGSYIEYRCKPGFETSDSEQIICLIDGMWSENPPTCVVASPSSAVTCPAFVLQNGQISPIRQQYKVGDTLTLTCNNGYAISPVESVFLMCVDGGLWSPPVGSCVLRAPPTTRSSVVTTPPGAPVARMSSCTGITVQNGEVWPVGSEHEIGTMITLFCHPGYTTTPADSDWSMCQTSGNWYPPVGTCQSSIEATTELPIYRPTINNVTCAMPTTPPHTRIVVSRSFVSTPGSSWLSVGSRLVYACEDGYYLTDSYHQSAANAPLQITLDCQSNGNWSNPMPTCRVNDERASAVPVLDPSQITAMFKSQYWNYFDSSPSARFRACAWGGVAEILPDPDNRYQTIVVCASGSVIAVSSNCINSTWKAVIGPPRGIVGWSQDPFYAADLDAPRRQIYLTSSVTRLGILGANLDILISAGLRGATIQPQYIVPGTTNGLQFEGIVVDPDPRLIYSADGGAGQISVWSLIDGWPFAKISRPNRPAQTFQPRHLALSAPSGPQNRRILAVTDYVNSQLTLFSINKDNISLSEYVSTIASYTGRCDLGSIGRPSKLKFDQGGNIIVADGGCGRVQIFASDATSGRQTYRAIWASKNLGQYVTSVLPVLSRATSSGNPYTSIMAGLNSGEVVCFD